MKRLGLRCARRWAPDFQCFIIELFGKYHCEIGPAIEYTDGLSAGSKYWFVHGKRHREDGQACIDTREPNNNGWYLDNVEYTEVGFNEEIAKRKAEKHGR